MHATAVVGGRAGTAARAGTLWACAMLALALASCSEDEPGSAKTSAADGAGNAGSSGTTPAAPGGSGAPALAGGGGAGGSASAPPASSGTADAGNSGGGGRAGSVGSAGGGGTTTGAAGAMASAGSGGSSEPTMPEPMDYDLDCGPAGVALEGHGPPSNRVNYVIVGDGYAQNELDTLYLQHVKKMLEPRFSPEFEPYPRYRNFVNICALKVASQQSGITMNKGNTAFDGYGNDESRLGYINDSKVNAKIEELLPAEIEVDWKSVVLNDSSWWNSGGRIMVWSGGHKDAALAAEHEGGHAFLILADEYGGDCTFSGSEDRMRVNVTMDKVNTADKWKLWLGFDQTPGTGMQGTFEGAQFCDRGAWRPSDESVMNMLWDSSYYNAISKENGIREIYDKVKPIDESTPTTVTTPQVLEVKVVDPAVLKVDWSVDGKVVEADGGASFDVAAQGLPAGSHQIAARAYDDTEWVRGDRAELEQTVTWTIAVP